jgi:hypothetical protein
MKKFIIVLTKVKIEDKKSTPLYKLPATDMKVKDDEKGVLDYIATVGFGNHDDPRRIQTIFSVDEFGNISHFEIKFNGRLILVPTLSTTMEDLLPEDFHSDEN